MATTILSDDYTSRKSLLKLLPILLISATPPLMAILSWDLGSDRSPFRQFILTLSLSVIFIELLIILIACRHQFSPFTAIGALTLGVRFCLGSLAIIATATASLVSHIPATSLFCGLIWLVHLLFGFSIVHLVQQGILPIDRKSWALLSCGIAAYGVMLAFFILMLPDKPGFQWVHGLPGVTHIRHIGNFSLLGFLAAFALANGSRQSYWVGIILGSIGIGLAMWSGTRGAIMAVAVAMFAGLICFRQLRSTRIVAWLVLTLLGGAALSILYIPPSNAYGIWRMITASGETDAKALSSNRTELWAATAREIAKRPLFGYGEREFVRVVLEKDPDLPRVAQPHNIFLQIALQWGLVGAACFFSLAAMLCTAFYRKALRIGEEAVPAFLIVTAILVYSLYDAALFYPYPIMIAAFCIAAILGRPDKADAG